MKAQNLDINLVEEPKRPLSMNPKKFILWLFIVSIVMMFAAWTSAYIVAQTEGLRVEADFPSMFNVSTAILLLSSVTMHLAYRSAKKNSISSIKLFSVVTFVLGLIFLYTQVLAFGELIDAKVFFVGSNPIESFTFLLPFMHGVHIIAGLIFLIVILFKTFRYKVHSKNMNAMEMCATFWHFLDGLWLYLFLFLQFN